MDTLTVTFKIYKIIMSWWLQKLVISSVTLMGTFNDLTKNCKRTHKWCYLIINAVKILHIYVKISQKSVKPLLESLNLLNIWGDITGLGV